MADFDLYSLRNVFTEYGVMICFNGPFSHSVIEELGIAVRKYLESNDAPKNCIADVFAVFIEQAQNLKNYTSSGPFSEPEYARYKNGTLVIAREGDRYIVSSGNFVRDEDCPALEQSLSSVRVLDKLQLKALYKERLRSASPAASGGAGLGFIDMARKASDPLAFSVRRLADGSTFFNISVSILAG